MDKYVVVIAFFGWRETKTQPMSWIDACHYATGASALAEMVWSRHPAVTTVIRHCNTYGDVFNEGSINIEKVS